MSLPYPNSASIRAQRAFLGAIVATIIDLGGRDAEESQKFLTDLQLHIRHFSQVIPEALEADRHDLEALHGHLLHWYDALLTKFDEMSEEEWQQGSRARAFWNDLYQTLDNS